MKTTSALAQKMQTYKSLELQGHISLDDVIGKVVEEIGEIMEAYSQSSKEELDGEIGDALINILSVSASLGGKGEIQKTRQSPTTATELLSKLSIWHQKVQGFRQRYIRHQSTEQDVELATKALVGDILSLTGSDFSLDSIIVTATKKLESRIEAYKPNIEIKDYIEAYPDFPSPGILFRDISPLLASPEVMRYVCFEIAKNCQNADVIAGLDARGFLFGVMVASILGKPFVMIRKKGKLPGKTVEQNYSLEYGKNVIEVQEDALKKGQRVAIIDDLLATGGTIEATTQLIEKLGGEVDSVNCVISLDDEFLQSQPARKNIEKYGLNSIVNYK